MNTYEVPYYRPPNPNHHKLGNMLRYPPDPKIVSNGPYCRDLEDNMRELHGSRYALSCSSCTTGLFLALKALKKLTGAKDAYLPSFTWSSTEIAVEAAGLNRIFTDSDPATWTMMPTGAEDAITVPVSIFGAEVNPLLYKGSILVDGAHMLGIPLDYTRIAGCLISFAPSKLLTCGEGGMLLTDFAEVAAEFEALRNKYGRLSEANAALGLCHWEGLDAYVRDRRNRYARYAPLFKKKQKFGESNCTTFAARVPDRKAFQLHMKTKGIETRAYYEPLVKGLETTDLLGQEVVCLPNWYGCPDDKVVAAVKAFKGSI